ncbi:MAG TPA: TadE family protein [Microvirga sp.]|nr:TadE family protein [Microvirga sp.]
MPTHATGSFNAPRRQPTSGSWRTRARSWAVAWAGRSARDQDGVSAVEFALVAPILAFSLVAAIDVGLAEYERMAIDHALRAAAQSAMADQGPDAVLRALQTTASKNFTLSDGTTSNPDALKVSVKRFCACPEATGTEVSCSTVCAGPTSTFIYYRLTGTKFHKAAMLPPIELSPSVQVQVR